MSERWVEARQYCPACGFEKLKRMANNRPVSDFVCEACAEQFELKSKNGRIGRKIADGAYRTMIERITGEANPSFLLLSYSKVEYKVVGFEVIPKHFFTPQIIEKRKPLSPTARRAGWVGCNIVVDGIPASGRIALISHGETRPSVDVVGDWRRTMFLRNATSAEARSWMLSVMHCVERLPCSVFKLDDIYQSEGFLSARFPANRHVRPKIRQQLQVLRDKGYLEFLGRGVYLRSSSVMPR